MARLNAVGHNRNISISLPQKMIDQLEAQLRGKSMKRSHWVGDAINRKLRDTDPELFADRSLHQIMLHLICRRDFSDLESVRLDELYEKMFGPLPVGARNGLERRPVREILATQDELISSEPV